MAETMCHYKGYENPIREFKANTNGIIKNQPEQVIVEPWIQEWINKNLAQLPVLNENLRSSLSWIWLSSESIEKVLQRKHLIFVQVLNKEWTWYSAALWMWESVVIDGNNVLISAGHVVGWWSSKHIFDGSIISIHTMDWSKVPFGEYYRDRNQDIGFVQIPRWLQNAYNLDQEFPDSNNAINTGSPVNTEINVVQQDWMRDISNRLTRFFWVSDNIDLDQQLQLPKLTKNWESGSFIIDENWNPLCLAQQWLELWNFNLMTICWKLNSIRQSFRDYRLLSLKKRCTR